MTALPIRLQATRCAGADGAAAADRDMRPDHRAGPMMLPVPISTCGPITACGLDADVVLKPAVGWTTAAGAMPASPNSERRAERIGMQPARNRDKRAIGIGDAQRRDALRHLAFEPAADQAGRRMAVRKLRGVLRALSRKVRCDGPASSSTASPVIGTSARSESTSTAPVISAISASVSLGGSLKNL